MATCPRCKGHLTDNHRCPRSPMRVAIELVLAGAAGGIAGLLLASMIDPHGQLALDAVLLVTGILAAAGLDYWLRA